MHLARQLKAISKETFREPITIVSFAVIDFDTGTRAPETDFLPKNLGIGDHPRSKTFINPRKIIARKSKKRTGELSFQFANPLYGECTLTPSYVTFQKVLCHPLRDERHENEKARLSSNRSLLSTRV